MPYWIDNIPTPYTGPVFEVNMKPRTVRGLLASMYASKPTTKFRIVSFPGQEEGFDSHIIEFEEKASKPMIKQYENGCVMYRLLLPSDNPAEFTVIDNQKPILLYRDRHGRITRTQRRDARGARGPEREYDNDLPKK